MRGFLLTQKIVGHHLRRKIFYFSFAFGFQERNIQACYEEQFLFFNHFKFLKNLLLCIAPIWCLIFYFYQNYKFFVKLKQSSGFLWHFAPKVNIRCTWWWLCLPRYFNDLKGHFEICRLYKIQNYVLFITWYFTSAKCFTSLGKNYKREEEYTIEASNSKHQF